MFFLARLNGRDGSEIGRSKSAFRYPLSKDRSGAYKVPSGAALRVCLTSDFFLEDADPWRAEAWDVIRRRPDVLFFLLTKRPHRVADSLPPGWNSGWENVRLSVSAENQRRADERIPILLSLPFRHKGVMCAPLIGPISLGAYLASGQIEEVLCDGENYEGARPCRYEWVKSLRDECAALPVLRLFLQKPLEPPHDVRVALLAQARRSGLSFEGRPTVFKLTGNNAAPAAGESGFLFE